MKKLGSLILAGFIPLLVLFLFMKFVSLNISYSVVVGALTLLMVSYWQKENQIQIFIKGLLLLLPICIAYSLLIISDIGGMWIAIPLFILSVCLGLTINRSKKTFFLFLGWIAIIFVASFILVPKIISNNLAEYSNKPSPEFEIRNLMEGANFTKQSTQGKVIVLDFFGTWCAPCIAEMSELKEIKSELRDYEDKLVFIIACTDTGGDTPEKALQFHSRRELPFLLGFDDNSNAHKSFGFSGVPGLVILDKNGNVRFKHEGYNQAEDFKGIMIPILQDLLNE